MFIYICTHTWQEREKERERERERGRERERERERGREREIVTFIILSVTMVVKREHFIHNAPVVSCFTQKWRHNALLMYAYQY